MLPHCPHRAIQDSDFNFVETDTATPGRVKCWCATRCCRRPDARGRIAFESYLPSVKIGEVIPSIRAAGFDAVIDYESEDIQARLKELCPKGIDIFFDDVAGDILASEVLGRIEARTSRPLVAPFRARHPDRAPRITPRRRDSRA